MVHSHGDGLSIGWIILRVKILGYPRGIAPGVQKLSAVLWGDQVNQWLRVRTHGYRNTETGYSAGGKDIEPPELSRTRRVAQHEPTVAPGVERLPHSNGFEAAKDKGLILHNGTAHGKTELVAYEVRNITSCRNGWITIKEITSIQGRVAVIVIDGSMQFVG